MRKSFFGWILFIALAIVLFLMLQKNDTKYGAISLGEFTRLLKDGRVAFVDIGKDELFGEFRRPQTVGGTQIGKFRVPLPEGTTSNWAFTQWMIENRGDAGLGVREGGQNLVLNILVPLIPWLLIFGFIWFFVFRQLRGRGTVGADPLRVFVVNQPGQSDSSAPPPPLK